MARKKAPAKKAPAKAAPAKAAPAKAAPAKAAPSKNNKSTVNDTMYGTSGWRVGDDRGYDVSCSNAVDGRDPPKRGDNEKERLLYERIASQRQEDKVGSQSCRCDDERPYSHFTGCPLPKRRPTPWNLFVKKSFEERKEGETMTLKDIADKYKKRKQVSSPKPSKKSTNPPPTPQKKRVRFADQKR